MTTKRSWTEAEIEFLTLAYESGEYSIVKIADMLGRNRHSVDLKLKTLDIKKQKEEVPEGYKICSRCREILPLERFTKRCDRINSYRSWCRECRKFESRTNKNNATPATTTIVAPTTTTLVITVPRAVVEVKEVQEGEKKCKDCGEIKSYTHFFKNKNKKDGYEIYCKDCSNKRRKETMFKRIRARGY